MKRLICCVVVWCCGGAILAESEPDLERALRMELASLQQEFGFPGATAAFVFADGRAGEVAVGLADRETKVPMTPGSRMLAASIGKTFVSATALALAAEGRLDLDAPVSGWFRDKPWFSRLAQGNQITIRHLLMHRSGLADHVHTAPFAAAFKQRWPERENPFPPEDLISFVLDSPLHCVPGKGWAYSDTGYILVGLILEDVCGRSLSDAVAMHFLRPLGLTNTIPSNRRALEGLVPGYTSPQNPFGLPVKSTDAEGHLRWHPGVESFGGGWLSTSGDLARWGAALYGGTALPEAARTELRCTEPISDKIDSVRYGAGVSYASDGPLGPAWGHGGWIPGYVSSLRHYPDHGLTVAFQINTDTIQSDNWLSAMEMRLARVLISRQHAKEDADHE